MTAFFGQPWDAPVCEMGTQVDTPVGQPCLACEVPLVEGDRGLLIPYAPERGYPHLAAWHHGCFLESILGPGLAASLRRDEGGSG